MGYMILARIGWFEKLDLFRRTCPRSFSRSPGMREVRWVDYLSAYSLLLEGVLLHGSYDHDDGFTIW